MKRNYTLYNITNTARTLLITLCLLMAAGGTAWGRNITNNTAGFPQKEVPEIVYTIYLEQGSTRELAIAGLNSFSGQWVDEYQWYMRWYRMDANGKAKDQYSPLTKPTGSNLEAETNNRSLFWYKGMSGQIPSANKVNYTKGTEDDIVVCDVSSYTDGLPTNGNEDITEPVISKRYKFIIKDASEIRTKLNAVTDDAALNTILMTVPKGATGVNLQMDMTPENYYWGNNNQGNTFTATATDGNGNIVNGGFANNAYKMFHFDTPIETETTVKIYAHTQNNRSTSPCIALYKITPQEGWELSTEDAIKDNIKRNPRLYPKRYQEIQSYDFDLNNATNELTVTNNVSSTPLPAAHTSYGFTNPTQNSRNAFFTPKRNNYGLYRSANVESISRYNQDYTIGNQTRKYDWFFTRTSPGAGPNKVVYDRTYERTKDTNEQKHGYFYYIDASEEAGRIVNVPIGETLCPGTELTITAWVVNMTGNNDNITMTKPNLRFILRGVLNDQTEEEIYRFSTGEPNNDYFGEWLQIYSTFTLQSEQTSRYSSYKVEIQNNALNSDGADYAIDDIRVYKSLPNVSVYRDDVCDASTFYVSSDYENILRNMGWSDDPDVVAGMTDMEKLTDSNKHKWKYRYGLLGEDASNPQHFPYVGNMYLGFAKGQNLENLPTGSYTTPSANPDNWVTMNTDLLNYDNENYNNRSKLFRITIPTTYTGEGANNALANRFGNITTPEEARGLQILWNLRMVNDFLYDATQTTIWDDVIQDYAIDPNTLQKIEKNAYLTILEDGLKTLCNKTDWDYKIPVGSMHTQLQEIIDNTNGKGDRYEKLLRSVCSILGISRLRVPWWTFENDHPTTIHLSTIDVQKTDLQYKGQQFTNEDGTITTATGEYTVIIFNARSTTHEPGMVPFPNASVNFNDDCLLSSPFTVAASTNITIDTEGEAVSLPVCQSQITDVEKVRVWVRKRDPQNENEEDFKEYGVDVFQDGTYTYDWFLGSLSEYSTLGIDLKKILNDYRNNNNDDVTVGTFSADALLAYCESNYSNALSTLRVLLKGDTENPIRLVIGDEFGKTSFPWTDRVVAIPYFPNIETESVSYEFCVDPKEQTFQMKDSPAMSIRFPSITSYPASMTYVPLRIGMPKENMTLTEIPIGGNILFGMGDDVSTSLGLPEENAREVLLLTESASVPVGTVTALEAKKDGGKFSISFSAKAANYFEEGKEYRLYIPFQEHNANGVVEGSCVGYADLIVRIVPEYLTWKGAADAVWYNDDNWKQSTKKELYKGTTDEDANGNDDISDAFTPLYFTKVTIPNSSTLVLEPVTKDETTQMLSLPNDTENIQYDMAVADADGTITPYYINKVDQIYFKPQTKLMNQHELEYKKAWVEFEIGNKEKRWMTSPLQDVYAGDLYAPSANGRQETAAFTDITYNKDNGYSRWSPAFYQKAWNKAINYATTEDGNTMENVTAVKSNWSIEYNDVTVPYPIGKGFYLSVEDVKDNGTALVRLPKADAVADYKYEAATTKASVLRADETPSKDNGGKLVELTDDSYTLNLTEVDGNHEADGENKQHFLVGNPFMTDLDMDKFLTTNNSVLAKKYWTLKDGATNAVVGTPDVTFDNGSTNGTVAPMQAFFVELAENIAENTPRQITFTSDMMTTATTTENVTTKAAAAINPVITLTAESGEVKSRARLLTSDKADNGYQPQEDAIVLLDSELDAPMIYSVAGNRAAQVNAVKNIDNIPVGIYNSHPGDVTMTIEGISQLAEPLYLYDAYTRSSTLLEGDSYTIKLTGESHGRYYLRNSATGGISTNTITIYSVQNGKVIASSTEELRNIKVYTMNGTQIKEMNIHTSQHTFNLPEGIYLIRAEGSAGTIKTEKVLVR